MDDQRPPRVTVTDPETNVTRIVPVTGTGVRPQLRRFVLNRSEDISGMSGLGVVAEGVQFTDGTVALRWLTTVTSTVLYAQVDDLLAIHGHEGTTKLEWIDDEDAW